MGVLAPGAGVRFRHDVLARLRDWNEAGVWQQLHEVLLAELNAERKCDWSRCVVDSSHVRALEGGASRTRRRSTGAGPAPNTC